MLKPMPLHSGSECSWATLSVEGTASILRSSEQPTREGTSEGYIHCELTVVISLMSVISHTPLIIIAMSDPTPIIT